MNEQVIQLFKRGLVLMVIILLIDRGVGSLIEYYHKKEKQGDSSVTTYALTKASEDVIIFGSSRAAHHYVPAIISQETKMTAFNVGRDGMNLSYYAALLKGILAHHTPKEVILDLNLNDFQLRDNKESAMVASLLPYVVDNPGIGKLIKEKDPVEYWKANISKLYRYNSLPASIAQHNMGIGQKNYQGYEPLKGNKLKSISDTLEINDDYRENEGLVKSFEEFVIVLKTKAIPLHVVISPSSMKRKFNCKATASRILAKHGFILHDYSKFSGENRLALFYDATHMNDRGATNFTRVIVDDILLDKTSNNMNR